MVGRYQAKTIGDKLLCSWNVLSILLVYENDSYLWFDSLLISCFFGNLCVCMVLKIYNVDKM